MTITYDPRISSIVTFSHAELDAIEAQAAGEGRDADHGSGDRSDSGTGGKWVTNTQLVTQGVPESAQARARQSGRLKYVDVGNGVFSYKQTDVDAWLSGTRGRPARGSGSRPAAAASRATPRRSAKETLACLAGHVSEQEGISKLAAKQKILREDADLRQRLVAEANI